MMKLNTCPVQWRVSLADIGYGCTMEGVRYSMIPSCIFLGVLGTELSMVFLFIFCLVRYISFLITNYIKSWPSTVKCAELMGLIKERASSNLDNYKTRSTMEASEQSKTPVSDQGPKRSKKAQGGKGRKKIKGEDENEGDDGWVVVAKKPVQLTVSVSDFSKINRFYSHKSILNYIRYLLVQTIPNPMWLSIKRQSLVQQIVYLDIIIENNLFNSMRSSKELKFLGEIQDSNTAHFKPTSQLLKEDLWEAMLSYEVEKTPHLLEEQWKEMPQELNQQLLNRYQSLTLTQKQLKEHLYPSKQLPLYADFYQPPLTASPSINAQILIVDCEMVLSEAGFQLARTTIVNFKGQVLFDEFFKPQVQIKDYNTQYSGITAQQLDKVTNTIENKLHPFLDQILGPNTILVGHSLQNDLRAMKVIHNKVVDTSVLYMRKNGTKFKLKSLAEKILKRRIQTGEHDSLQDCLATLHLMRAKVERDQRRRRQFDLLREMGMASKKAAIIDAVIDNEIREYKQHKWYEVPDVGPKAVLSEMSKAVQEDWNLVVGRVEKPQCQWEQYYRDLDRSIGEMFNALPKMRLLFINCQIDPHIQIITDPSHFVSPTSTRPPCFILAR